MIKVKVPATSANIGPGFDSLGIAFNLYNTFTFEEIDEGIIISGCQEGFNDEDNLVYLSMIRTLDILGYKLKGIKINIEADIPISRGLGSSAACIVGGIMGASGLAGNLLSKDEILKIATEIEGHPDNVCPALFGGMTLSIMEDGEIIYNHMQIANGLKFHALVPDFTLSTLEARAVLPQSISHKDAIYNVSRVALLVSALSSGRFELLKYGLQDKLHQIYRGGMIPHYNEVIDICNNCGSIGTFLSGAGPTIMAITHDKDVDFKKDIGKQLNLLDNKWTMKELFIDFEGAIALPLFI